MSSLVGRESELGAVEAFLRSDRCRIVAIVGEPEIGDLVRVSRTIVRIWRSGSAPRQYRPSASSKTDACVSGIPAPRGCRELERELAPWLH